MNRNSKILIGVFAVFLTALLVFYFTANQKKIRRFQWDETYRAGSLQPYGTSVIQKLLASYRPGQRFIFNDKTPIHIALDTATLKEKTDFVFVGGNIFFDEEDTDALLSFIDRGNDAFIASVNIPFSLLERIYPDCGESINTTTDSASTATMNFYNVNLKSDNGVSYTYRFGSDTVAYYWTTFDQTIFCDTNAYATPLGYKNPDNINFVKISYGKGNLYIHSNPLVFTNYFMLERDKVEYAANVFSHLTAQSIIWDEFSKSNFDTRNNEPTVNPLAYILQQESLRYAWWLMLLCAILYVLFTAKRRQRVIPVLEEKTNTSLEFVQMISILHVENANTRDIARKKIKYFFYYIRARYGIQAQKLTPESQKRLSEKSRMPLADLEVVAQEFDHAENSTIYRTEKLTDLHRALEKLYKIAN